jgi:nucleoid-associated protein YgaU
VGLAGEVIGEIDQPVALLGAERAAGPGEEQRQLAAALGAGEAEQLVEGGLLAVLPGQQPVDLVLDAVHAPRARARVDAGEQAERPEQQGPAAQRVQAAPGLAAHRPVAAPGVP